MSLTRNDWGDNWETVCTMELELAESDSIYYVGEFGRFLLVQTEADLFYVVDPLSPDPRPKFLHWDHPKSTH